MEENEKYKVFNRTSFPNKRADVGTPTVSFTPGSGEVYFSKAASQLMGFDAGDYIEVIQKGNDPLAIGFRKTDDTHGFRLYRRHDGRRFVSVKLVRNLLYGFGRLRATVVQVANEPTGGVWWILRKSLDPRD